MNSLLPLRCLGLVPVLSLSLLGQAFPQEPLELRQSSAMVNLSSIRSIAPSSSTTNPAGSDGRTLAPGSATSHQFQSVMTFGGGVGIGGSPAHPPTLKTNRSLVENAVGLNLPRLGGANPTHVLLRARIGSPVVNGAPGTSIKAVADLTVSRTDVGSPK